MSPTPPAERRCFILPPAELERRWTIVRALMREHGLDALVVQGANNLSGIGGHYAWFTGLSASGSYPQTVVFFADQPMTVIRHGADGTVAEYDPTAPETYGMERYLGTPSFPSACYTLLYDANLVAQTLRKAHAGKVGLVSPGTMYGGFLDELRRQADSFVLSDFTEVIDEPKAIKSGIEIDLIRKAAAMQDQILAELPALITPGMRDCEVMAEAHRIGQRLGSETGFFLGSSFTWGDPTQAIRHRPEQGRVIREGDIFLFLAENAGPGGMYVHLTRFIGLGKIPSELVDAIGVAIEAQDYTMSLLTPGAASADVFAEYNAYMRRRGFPEEVRLHAHGQGYDVVERPLIRGDESMEIKAGMNLGVHPFIVTRDVVATNCDNYIIRESGSERVHKSKREIFVP